MKKRILIVALIVLFLLSLGISKAHAQSGAINTVNYGPVLPPNCSATGTFGYPRVWYLTTAWSSYAAGFYWCNGSGQWTSSSGGGGGMVYPSGTGVPQVISGDSWGTTLQIGTGANNLVQLNGSGQLPAVSGYNLTNLLLLTGTRAKNLSGDTNYYTVDIATPSGIRTYTWPDIGGPGTFGIISSGCSTVTALFNLGTGGGIECSSVTDDGINPTRAPNGLDTVLAGVYAERTADTGGVVAGQVVCVTSNVDTSGWSKVAPCSHTATNPGAGLVGIALNSAAAGATVKVCWSTGCSALFDNQSVVQDEAIISTTTDGELHDTGAQTATAGQQNFVVQKANTGTGTASPVGITDANATNPKGGGGNGNINGTLNYIPKFSSKSSIGNSSLLDNGSFMSLTNEGFSLNAQPLLVAYTNCSSGTAVGLLVTYDAANNCVSTVTTSDTSGAIGVVYAGAGTSGTVEVAQGGTVTGTFDGPTTQGDYIQISSTTAGDLHDAGSTYPTSGEVVGHVDQTIAAAGSASLNIFSPDVGGTASVCKNTTGCGSSGGSSLSNVVIQGDGTVYQSGPAPSSTTSGVETVTPSLMQYPPGYILRTAIPATGTNVGVVETTVCAGTSTFTCTISPGWVVPAGDTLVWQEWGGNGSLGAAPTDNCGNTWVTSGTTNAVKFVNSTVACTLTSVTIPSPGAYGVQGILSLLSGSAGIDAVGTASCANSTTCSATASATSTQSNDAMLAFAMLQNANGNNPDTVSFSPSLSQVFMKNASGYNFMWSEIGGLGAAGSYSETMRGSVSGTMAIYIVLIKQSATAANSPWVAGPLPESFLPRSAISQIQETVRCTGLLTTSVPNANQAYAILTCAVTMPSSGGPFKVLGQYHIYGHLAGSQTTDLWIGDGTSGDEFAGTESESSQISGFGSSEISPASYSNSQAVTFTLYIAASVAANTTLNDAPATAWTR